MPVAAVSQHPLQFAHQPIFDVVDGVCRSYELLARPPGYHGSAQRESWFSSLEASDKVACVDAEAMRLAFGLGAARPAGDDGGSILVNVSARSLESREWWDALAECRRRSPDALSHVIVELTERVSERDPGTLMQSIEALRSQGMRFCLDDVASADGRHDCGAIELMRPDVVKLCGEALAATLYGTDRDYEWGASNLLRHIRCARQRGAWIIAEGIDGRGSYDFVVGLGVDGVQGFWLGVPR